MLTEKERQEMFDSFARAAKVIAECGLTIKEAGEALAAAARDSDRRSDLDKWLEELRVKGYGDEWDAPPPDS